MDLRRVVALVLIVGGILGLVYRGFSYTKESHEAKLGPLEFSVREKETVYVPTWAGIGSIAAGTMLLLMARKR
jgi:hypothetical protein